AARAGRGVLLHVLALLLLDGRALLVGGALLALLHLVAAPAVDRFVADDQAVRAGAAPAGPRDADDVGGRRLPVAGRRRRRARVQVAALLADFARLVDVRRHVQVVRLVLLLHLVRLLQQLADEVVELLLDVRLDGVALPVGLLREA